MPGGMTGWAQVHGWRGRTSLRKRIQYDLDYIQRWTIGMDLRILLDDDPARLLGKDLVERIEASGLIGALSDGAGACDRPPPVCSIVIPTYNGRELLRCCLASIERRRPDPRDYPIEIVVVDNGSSDGTSEWLAQTARTSEGCGSSRTPASAWRPMPGSPRRGAPSSNSSTTTPKSLRAGSRRPWPRSPTRRSGRWRRWYSSGPIRRGSTRPAIPMHWSAGRPSAATDSRRNPGPRGPPTKSSAPAAVSAFYRTRALRSSVASTPSSSRTTRTSTWLFDCDGPATGAYSPREPDPPRHLRDQRSSQPRTPAPHRPQRRAGLLVEPPIPDARPGGRAPPGFHHRTGRLASGSRTAGTVRRRQARRPPCLATDSRTPPRAIGDRPFGRPTASLRTHHRLDRGCAKSSEKAAGAVQAAPWRARCGIRKKEIVRR